MKHIVMLFLITVFLCCLVVYPGGAQIPGGLLPVPGATGSTPVPDTAGIKSGAPDAADAKSALPGETGGSKIEKKAEDLFMQTLPLDIQTAQYYELVSWCRRLGLDDAGDRKNLQNKLYLHYKLSRPQAAGEQTKSGRVIDIVAADLSRYFKLDKADTEQNYIQLDGNVAVTVKQDNVAHEIRAQRIVVNQEMKLLVAEGDIEYRKTASNGKAEVFRGESLSFNLKSLDGIFYNGVGETLKKIGDTSSELKFLYSGKKIIKLENDNIIIDHAVITSSQSLDYPNWKITADRIWVLAPEEWAARNAVLYIGEIPILGLPYFFNPGDELFFNPVLGYRSREGNFIQTTTYLVGEKAKDKKQNSFSLINIGSDENTTYKTEWQGLFLKKMKSTDPVPVTQAQGEYLKVMLDIYSRLGYFAGIDLDFTNYGKLMGGIGVSTTVVPDNNGQYTNLIRDEDGHYVVDWNYYPFPGFSLPLRYGFEGSFKLPPIGKLAVSTTLEAFSDPFFPSDFYNRSETVDLLQLLDKSNQTEGVSASDKNNLSWLIISSLDLSDKILAPYINQLRFSRLNLEFSWISKNAVNIDSSPYFNYDPARAFFIPQRMKLPEIQLETGGQLLQLPATAALAVKKDKPVFKPDPGKGSRSPFADSIKQEEEKKIAQFRDELKIPVIKADSTGIADISTKSEAKLNYEFRPRIQQENVFLSNTWQSQSDIDYAMQYSKMEYQVPLTLSYNTLLLGNFFILNGALRLDWKKQESYKSPDLTIIQDQDWLNYYLLNDYRGSYFTLNNNFTATMKPFFTVYDFQNSELSYTLNWLFYNYKYDSMGPADTPLYKTDAFFWDKTTITSHSFITSLVYGTGNKPLKLSVTNQLPPLDKKITSSLGFFIWEFNNSLTTVIKEQADTWVFDPLTFQSSLSLPWLYFTEKINYNIEENQWVDSSTNVKLLKLNNQFFFEEDLLYSFTDNTIDTLSSKITYNTLQLSFLINRQVPLAYSFSTFNWVESGEKTLMPADLRFSYNFKLEPFYFWKNRINVASNINTSWNLNFNKVTESRFAINADLNFTIYKFLKLKFSVSSYNDKLYNYFPFLFDKVKTTGDEVKNVFFDLIRSFNFFNDSDRYISDFKMRNISLNLTHQLEDWNLSYDLTGKYEKSADGLEMEWKPVFSIIVQWIPIPEMKKEIKYNNDGLNIGG